MKMKYLTALLLFYSLLSGSAFAEQPSPYWQDFKTSFNLIVQGSYLQFSSTKGQALLATGTAATLYALDRDQVWSRSAIAKGPSTFETRLSNDWSVLTNLPTIPLTFYFVANSLDDQKMKNFAIETFSTMYLVMLEALSLSFIPIHDRPARQNLSGWENNFRSTSSFPSGHVLGLAALTFKSYEFYGPFWATIPAVATYFISMERVESGKHYPTDVIGGIFMAAMASEGVKIANQKQTSGFSQWIGEHQAHGLIYPGKNSIHTALSFSF